jgi:hypothetical protein
VIFDLFSIPDLGLLIGSGAFADLPVGGLGDVFWASRAA